MPQPTLNLCKLPHGVPTRGLFEQNSKTTTVPYHNPFDPKPNKSPTTHKPPFDPQPPQPFQTIQAPQPPPKKFTCCRTRTHDIIAPKDITMMQNLPAETLQIAPEALEVANCYLQLQDAKRVAQELDLAPTLVTEILSRREVKSYIDHVFMDTGFNNKFEMRAAMDALIKQKFQELHESQTGSTKDIAELLQISHKMSMDLLDREIQLEKLRQGPGGPQKQVNLQINELDGSKYSHLISKLISGDGL